MSSTQQGGPQGPGPQQWQPIPGQQQWQGDPRQGYAGQQYPPPGAQFPPQYMPHPPPKKKRHMLRNIVLALVVLIVIITIAANSGGGGSNEAGQTPGVPTAEAAGGGNSDQVAIGQPWTSDNGNVVVVGQPVIGPSTSPLGDAGQQVVSVPVTLQNNGDEEWATVLTSISGTLDGRPLEEALGEGDFAYSTPLAPGQDVTLNKVFEVDSGGELEVTVDTPHGTGFFTGPVS